MKRPLLPLLILLFLPILSHAATLAPPTNVAATVAGNVVSFTWTPASGAQGYNLYQAASAAALPTSTSATPTVNGSTLNGGTLAKYSFPAGACTGTCFYEMTAWACTGSTCTVSAFSPAVSVTVGGSSSSSSSSGGGSSSGSSSSSGGGSSSGGTVPQITLFTVDFTCSSGAAPVITATVNGAVVTIQGAMCPPTNGT
jgi:uncharacterized membrane protein YgcG